MATVKLAELYTSQKITVEWQNLRMLKKRKTGIEVVNHTAFLELFPFEHTVSQFNGSPPPFMDKPEREFRTKYLQLNHDTSNPQGKRKLV